MSLLIADPALRMYCVNGSCYLHHSSKQKSFSIKALENKPLKKIMSYLQKPKSEADLLAFLAVLFNADHQKCMTYIKELSSNGFVKSLQSSGEENEWQLYNWTEAGLLHAHTINTPRVSYSDRTGNDYDVALMKEYVAKRKPPENFKSYPGEMIKLKKPDIDRKFTLETLLAKNRKSRTIDIKLLSRILYYGFGKVGDRYMQVTGRHVHKTVPSGGARHPYEFYLLINDVVGLDPGIYHYQFNDHYLTRLESLPAEKIQALIEKYLVIDPNRLNFNPQLAVVYSCIFERSMHRYRYSRSYRVMQYDLGHIYQNLEFLARAYGLNIYSGYSCHEQKIEDVLGVDSIAESCMGYAVL